MRNLTVTIYRDTMNEKEYLESRKENLDICKAIKIMFANKATDWNVEIGDKCKAVNSTKGTESECYDWLTE